MTSSASTERYRVARKFYESLMVSERLASHRIERYQESQLQQLLAHTAQHVPFYRAALSSIRKDDGQFDLSRWHELPVVSRDIVGAQWENFQSCRVPVSGLYNTCPTGITINFMAFDKLPHQGGRLAQALNQFSAVKLAKVFDN